MSGRPASDTITFNDVAAGNGRYSLREIEIHA